VSEGSTIHNRRDEHVYGNNLNNKTNWTDKGDRTLTHVLSGLSKNTGVWVRLDQGYKCVCVSLCVCVNVCVMYMCMYVWVCVCVY